QVLDLEQKFDVLAPVQAVPGPGLLRREAWKLGLPIAQDIRFDGQQTGHLADPKVQLVRYLGCIPGYFRICHQPSVILPYCARIVTMGQPPTGWFGARLEVLLTSIKALAGPLYPP